MTSLILHTQVHFLSQPLPGPALLHDGQLVLCLQQLLAAITDWYNYQLALM